MNESLLIIEDDKKLISLLKEYLGGFGYTVYSATLPSEGLKLLKRESPNLVILDVMLPEMDGFEVCRTIRQDSSVPIIMLTARGDVTDRIVGLEIGADDYLPKPFEPRELVARIQSILRRGKETKSGDSDRFGSLEIFYQRRIVKLEEERIELTTAEFEILSLFTQNPGRVFNRDQILDYTRGIEWEAFNRSVDVMISRLRRKLKDDPKHPRFFRTVWGTGYVFIGEEQHAD
ncbi:MAG: response regulator transcription factor [Calditrichota bacterium]